MHFNTAYNEIKAVEVGDDPSKSAFYNDDEDEFSRREQEIKRARMEEEQAALQRLQLRVKAAQQKQQQSEPHGSWQSSSQNPNNPSNLNMPHLSVPPLPSLSVLDPKERRRRHLQEQQRIQAIITSVAEETARKEALALAEAAERKVKEETAASANAVKRKDKDKDKDKERRHKKLTPEEKAAKEASKEKRLIKLVGAVVVKSMSKYAKVLGKDDFKKYAKEVSWPTYPVLRVLRGLVE